MSSIRRILVTGGSGRIGKAIMSDLVAQSYDVVNVDVVDADFVDTVIADLVLPQEYLKIKGSFDAIVHLAGLPSLRNATPQEVFMVNTSTAHNVLEFAYQNEIRKVIMASSEAVIGLANSYLIVRPVILPVDEAHPLLAQDAYGLSKGVQEQIALGFARRCPGMSIVNLRFSWVRFQKDYPGTLADIREDPARGVRKIFSYVDIRDASNAVRLAIEWDGTGHEALFVSAADTLSESSSGSLAREFFPGVPLIADLLKDHNSLVDCSRAHRILGYSSTYSWRASGNS